MIMQKSTRFLLCRTGPILAFAKNTLAILFLLNIYPAFYARRHGLCKRLRIILNG